MHPVQQGGQHLSRYQSPATLDQALRLLADHGPRGRAIAGGTDLLLELERGGRPEVDVLVDLTRIPDLDRIEQAGDTVTLGPLVTHNQVVASSLLVAQALPLAQACLEVGSAQLRNRATVAGNLITASPANDTISALLALDATITVRSLRRGQRTLPLAAFHTGFRTTALEPDELVTAISFPALGGTRRGVFAKLGLRRAQAISVVHATIVLDLDESGRARDPRVALGSVAPTVVRSGEVEAVLDGAVLDDEVIDRAAGAAQDSVRPIDDLRATAEYRRDVVGVLVERSLRALAQGSERAAWPDRPVLLWGRAGGSPHSPGDGQRAVTHEPGSVIEATVNGRAVTAPGQPSATLLDWLRESVGVTGSKEGCAEGECGACTVHLDGLAVLSCLVPAARAHRCDVVTIEGLAATAAGDGPAGERGPRLHPLQQAFIDRGAVQCGYCIPGFLMAGAKLLEEQPDPSPDQVRQGLAGNLCRCTGYYAILAAMEQASRELRRQGRP